MGVNNFIMVLESILLLFTGIVIGGAMVGIPAYIVHNSPASNVEELEENVYRMSLEPHRDLENATAEYITDKIEDSYVMRKRDDVMILNAEMKPDHWSVVFRVSEDETQEVTNPEDVFES